MTSGFWSRWFTKTRGVLLLLACVAAALAMHTASAANVTHRMAAVTEVVAGILSYARWPAAAAETSSGKLQLCVVGPTEYADVLLQNGNSASRWHAAVKRLDVDDRALTTVCNALYVGVLNNQETQRLFSHIQGFHILSISERDPPCSSGSMFCLTIHDEMVTFDINLDSVARSGVKIHPHVLKLGRRASSP